MPKTLPEKIIFTIIMAAIMVYGMIVYNVALATGGVTNATFGMALHEMPIMVPVAFVLEFFVVEKLATARAFTFMKPTDRPQFITYAISLMIVCIMCPVMSLVATLLFKEPSFGTWVHTWGCNMPIRQHLWGDLPHTFRRNTPHAIGPAASSCSRGFSQEGSKVGQSAQKRRSADRFCCILPVVFKISTKICLFLCIVCEWTKCSSACIIKPETREVQQKLK